eukprot:Nitzschia sp. Nitz4//scaffold185_size43419//37879//38349//NITZ4_007309-RA/size43419-processed-gene-0.84-mRNA-1//-1//CDS//3329539733//8855//frame0
MAYVGGDGAGELDGGEVGGVVGAGVAATGAAVGVGAVTGADVAVGVGTGAGVGEVGTLTVGVIVGAGVADFLEALPALEDFADLGAFVARGFLVLLDPLDPFKSLSWILKTKTSSSCACAKKSVAKARKNINCTENLMLPEVCELRDVSIDNRKKM